MQHAKFVRVDGNGNGEGCEENEIPLPSTKDEGEEQTGKVLAFLASFEEKYPRTYNAIYDIIFRIFVPLLMLNIVAMICGHFVALAESSTEISSNDATMDSMHDDCASFNAIVPSLTSVYNNCLDKHLSSGDSGNNLKEFITNCTSRGLATITAETETLRDNQIKLSYSGGITQNWIQCKDSDDGIIDLNSLFLRWRTSFRTISEAYIKDGLDEAKSYELARNEATGHDGCKVFSAGGALFWFTVMTTIGYGNAVPITITGRTIVVILGFLSILGFTTCVNQASGVMLRIVDGIFENHERLKPLAKDGFFSALMWLVMLILWTLWLSGVAMLHRNNTYFKNEEAHFSYGSALWWAFASVTTVGFGDIFVIPQRFTYRELYFVPFQLLIAFLLLGNFLKKLVAALENITKDKGTI